MPKLHDGQLAVHNSTARFRVVPAGRRWGKTLLGSAECIESALNGGRAWWVAPSYKMARVGWRGIYRLAMQIPEVTIRRGDLMVEFPTGGEIWVRSADNPDSLRGEGLDFAVLDEVAYMKESAWTESIRPALSDRNGRALFISTPRGHNWFWSLWVRGKSGDPDWASFGGFPTTDNPFINPAEVEEARRNLPDVVFRQEYMAEFVDDTGGVFRRVVEAATAEPQSERIEGHEYVFGIDWGRSNDYTVISVVDINERALVAIDRFSQVDYHIQLGRVRGMYERFMPTAVIVETNAMGEPMADFLRRSGIPVVGFYTDSITKQIAIDSLALAFEQGTIRIINDQTLINELQAFSGEKLPSGRIRYSAPPGMHDDCVMSLALAWHGVKSNDVVLFTV